MQEKTKHKNICSWHSTVMMKKSQKQYFYMIYFKKYDNNKQTEDHLFSFASPTNDNQL